MQRRKPLSGHAPLARWLAAAQAAQRPRTACAMERSGASRSAVAHRFHGGLQRRKPLGGFVAICVNQR
eukprot:15416014-Alexandrium_andersonii.AAC.1